LAGLRQQSLRLWALLGCATVLMLLGLADDKWNLDWRLRLGVQFVVAAVAVFGLDWRLTLFFDVPLATGLLSILWIVGLTNSFNMLDNMDGLSAGVAAIAGGTLACVLLLAPVDRAGPQLFVAGFLLVLVGALVGFLFHNRPPAALFMGDAGSYFTGFCLSAATLLATYTSYDGGRRHAVLAPLCIMAVPLYDMISVILLRLREGRSPFQADKRHLSHRLVALGFSQEQAVLTIYVLTGTCSLGAILLHRVDLVGAVVVVLLILSVLALIAIFENTAGQKEAAEPAADHSGDAEEK
jgi:UDP-GlcNAc:undecaprenyl-phosphate GlcNAc-1-phosphate transferase